MPPVALGKPATPRLEEAASSGELPTIAVIIPTFNHAHYLTDAITSVLSQTRPADEIIVVDDGSTDDPAAVVAQFQKVQLIRRENGGLSAARNTGIRSCKSSHVVFLDADDRLLPMALQAGLNCIADRPDCAFVFGGYRLISDDNTPISPDVFPALDEAAHLAMLRKNQVGMVAAVLFRRDCLLAIDGFDEKLRRCEDYDIYLRITHRYPIAAYPMVVAEYRKHGLNMSNSYVEQLKTGLEILDRHQTRIDTDPATLAALREGRAYRKTFYISQMLGAASERWRAHHDIGVLIGDLIQAIQCSPPTAARRMLGMLARQAARILPKPIRSWIQRIRGRPYSIPVGSVRFGDLRRTSPISDRFGFDRGAPIDRYYIEKFIAQNAGYISGQVLETDKNLYTGRFGGEHVERSEVLSVEADNPHATIVGDLAQADTLSEAAFDCIVLTQTLQFIFDVRAAVATSYRALKPGGVLLVTVPGLSKMHDRWGWYWSFSAAALSRLLEEQFGRDAVSVETYGNVFSTTAFLYGISLEELNASDLAVNDADYPVIVAARAIKRKDA
jgi:glycosyltransferase involved in cell wall biosynthesis